MKTLYILQIILMIIAILLEIITGLSWKIYFRNLNNKIMTIIIYFTADKKNYQIIRPQTEGANRFAGDVRKLVEHVTCSTHSDGIKNYHSFEII